MVETLEEMRLNKKTIDRVVMKLRSLIQKVERAEGGVTDLEKRTGIDMEQLRREARTSRGDVNLESARPEGGRHFETDEARAQHDHAPRLCRARDDLPAIGERPQGAHMRQLRAGDLKPHGLGPGRQQQPIEFERAPVGERQPPRLRVKAFGDGAEP